MPVSVPHAVQSCHEFLLWFIPHLHTFPSSGVAIDKTIELLRHLKTGYCIVDMPQVRNLPSRRLEVMCPVASCRFLREI
jgi:hypothetical protein